MKGQKTLFSSNSDEWGTPKELVESLEREFGRFDLDPCATKENAKALKFFTKEDGGLKQRWFGKVFVNPPYSSIFNWAHKCSVEFFYNNETVIVFLVPARTDTRWFHQFIYKQPNVEIRFIKGRLRFEGGKYPAPFPSMLVIWKR